MRMRRVDNSTQDQEWGMMLVFWKENLVVAPLCEPSHAKSLFVLLGNLFTAQNIVLMNFSCSTVIGF
jgi:hypothetical protein